MLRLLSSFGEDIKEGAFSVLIFLWFINRDKDRSISVSFYYNLTEIKQTVIPNFKMQYRRTLFKLHFYDFKNNMQCNSRLMSREMGS